MCTALKVTRADSQPGHKPRTVLTPALHPCSCPLVHTWVRPNTHEASIFLSAPFKKLHNLTYLFSYGNDNPDYHLKYFQKPWEVYRTEQALCPTRWEEEWGEAGELSLSAKLRSSFKHQLLTASSEVRTGFKTTAKECFLKFPWSELISQGQKWSLSLANVAHACVLKFKPSYKSGSITKGEANHSNSLTRNIWCKWCRAFYPTYRRKND